MNRPSGGTSAAARFASAAVSAASDSPAASGASAIKDGGTDPDMGAFG
jgi:hypothetical protein